MKIALLAPAALLIGLVVWGVGIEPRFLLDDEAFEAPVPGLPEAWEGRTVAVLADFQVGMWMGNEGMAREAVEDAVDEGVSLALLAGDFVYAPDSARVRRAVALVAPLVEAGVPVVAVLGNHDYSLMRKGSPENEAIARYLRQRLAAAGVHVLNNEAVAVRINGAPLYVAGIGSVWADESQPAAAMADVPEGAARLVFMHNAESFPDLAAGAAPLAFAAHTHGGQVRLPGLPRWSWLGIVSEGEVVADGWGHGQVGAEGNRLYVNRGIGFSTLPVRINCRPELTLATLRRAEGAFPNHGPIITTDS